MTSFLNIVQKLCSLIGPIQMAMQDRNVCNYCKRINHLNATHCFFCGNPLYPQTQATPAIDYSKQPAPPPQEYLYQPPPTEWIAIAVSAAPIIFWLVDKWDKRRINRCVCGCTNFVPQRNITQPEFFNIQPGSYKQLCCQSCGRPRP